MDWARSLCRRTLLGSIGTTAGALVAGCSTSSDETAETPSTLTATQSPPETETRPETETHPETESRSETAPPSANELDGGPGLLPDTVWPLPHRGISHGAYLPDGPLFESEPVVDWQIVPTTSSNQYQYTPEFTQPVIADGRVYTVNRLWFGPNEVSPDQHFLRAYETTTGDELWEFTIPQGSGRSVPTRPAIRDGVVVVGQGQRLHTVGIAEGSAVGSRTFDEEIDAVYPTRDRTYVKVGYSLVALNADIEPIWRKDFDGFPVALAHGPDNLYVTVGRRLLALAPGTGDVRWQQRLPAVEDGDTITSLVTVADGVFPLQASGDLYAISDTGTQVWHADDRYRSLSTDGSHLYARTRTHGMLRALAVPTGTNIWEVGCEDFADCESGGSFRKPVVTENAVYASHSSGHVVAVHPTDGSVLWTLDGPTDFNHLSLGSDAVYGVGFEFDPLVKFQSSGT